jgi:hypothetical protein
MYVVTRPSALVVCATSPSWKYEMSYAAPPGETVLTGNPAGTSPPSAAG